MPGMTYDQVLPLPIVMSLTQAGIALGEGRDSARILNKRGEFPHASRPPRDDGPGV